MRAIEARRRVEPLILQLGGEGSVERWVQLLVIPLGGKDRDRPRLVHCAWNADRAHRAEQYLARIASRSAGLRDVRARTRGLSRREREILRHLAMDEDLPAIASELHVSHVTVRNHVQHILSKLQVHSVQEAVAVQVLGAHG